MTTGQITSRTPAGSAALEPLRLYRRAASYLTAAATHLSGNGLLREPLSPGDLKPRPNGRSGSAPAVNLAYAHLDRLIRDRNIQCLLVTGPRDGGAAVLANLFLEGSLGELLPDLRPDAAGVDAFVRAFDWPGGLPAHLAPAAPGQIQSGGELGTLATAFGAALDDPDLLVACVVGEDDMPTGASAASWAANRFLDPATSGAVLPIVDASAGERHGQDGEGHAGAIAAAMSDEDLTSLFRGYGWEPLLVNGVEDEVDEAMASAMDAAADRIAEIQGRARDGAQPAGDERARPSDVPPRWPVIVLRLSTTWDARRESAERLGEPDDESADSGDSGDPTGQALRHLEGWLRSFEPDELFDDGGRPVVAIRDFCDLGDLRLGVSQRANGGLLRAPLELPDAAIAAIPVSRPGAVEAAGLERVGSYLADVMRRSGEERNFRVFSPDPLERSELGALVEAGGRVVEMLSENVAERVAEGYLKTGGHAFFLSGEAFLQVAESQIGQFADWLLASRDVPWRPPLASLNLLLVSDAWRPDRRRYSHESASIINSLLTKKGAVVRITLPPDANTLVETVGRCLRSTGYINLVVTTGRPLPQWLSMAAARAHATVGASIWRWASVDDGIDPDVVLAAAGATSTLETLAAADLLRHDVPDLRVRVVNVMDLMRLDSRGGHPHALTAEAFEALFTVDRPVVFAFHGYPSAVHQLVSARPNPGRFHVRGHADDDAPTTPLGALVRAGQSRWQLAIEAIRRAGRDRARSSAALDRYTLRIEEHAAYVQAHGEDPEDVRTWRWPEA